MTSAFAIRRRIIALARLICHVSQSNGVIASQIGALFSTCQSKFNCKV